MQYLSELPEINSVSTDGDEVEFELEQEIEQLPDLGDNDPVVLVAMYAGQIVVTAGKVIEHKTIEGPDNRWSRIKIKGQTVQFNI